MMCFTVKLLLEQRKSTEGQLYFTYQRNSIRLENWKDISFEAFYLVLVV